MGNLYFVVVDRSDPHAEVTAEVIEVAEVEFRINTNGDGTPQLEIHGETDAVDTSMRKLVTMIQKRRVKLNTGKTLEELTEDI